MPNVRKTVALVVDVVVAALILLVIAPLFAAIALCVAVESRGKIFYRAQRAGYRGRTVSVLKFTKMVEHNGLPLTTDDDDRFTRIGRVLAKTKLDELPQLINVVRGDMALVGPRPEDPQFVALHPDRYEQILSVRPGITGVSQLAYASESEILLDDDPVEDYIGRVLPQKVNLDVKYAEAKSLALDARVLFWTIAAVILRRDVAVNRSTLDLTLREARSQARVPAPQPARTAGRGAAFELAGVRDGGRPLTVPHGLQISTAQARRGELRVLERS
jgi:lipopolysaccharide/colanic/teichoic acid biosynthesis glycosyltransferase